MSNDDILKRLRIIKQMIIIQGNVTPELATEMQAIADEVVTLAREIRDADNRT